MEEIDDRLRIYHDKDQIALPHNSGAIRKRVQELVEGRRELSGTISNPVFGRFPGPGQKDMRARNTTGPIVTSAGGMEQRYLLSPL